MNQRIDFLERQVEFNREETAKISALTEKFAKVETQFKGLGALHATEQRRDEARLTKVEGKVENIFCWREEWMLMALPADAQQTRRLDNLERVVFKEDK